MAERTPDPQQDALFREVEEDLRHEQINRLWKQYGGVVVAAALLVIIVVAGYQGWTSWKHHQRTADAVAFEGALAQAKTAPDAAAAALAEVAKTSQPGTAALADLERGALLTSQGKVAEALDAYHALSTSTSANAVIRDVATIRYALLGIDNGVSTDSLSAAVAPLAAAGQPLEFSARQVQGIIALHDGKNDQARTIFQALVDDANCPPGLRARASSLLAQLTPAEAASPTDAKPSEK